MTLKNNSDVAPFTELALEQPPKNPSLLSKTTRKVTILQKTLKFKKAHARFACLCYV